MTSPAEKRGDLIVLVGPSGVGKSTISRELASRMDLKYIVSATTRKKNEKDDLGKTYDYVDEPTFFRKLENGEFLEYAAVWDEYYGTPKHPTLDHLESGQDVLLEIDVQGAFQVRFQYPDALMIFIMPPDQTTLLKRLRERGRDSEESIQKRFRGAKREIWMAKGSRAFDDMVINDNVERAVEEISRLIRHKKSPVGFEQAMIEALKSDEIVNKVGGRFKLTALIQKRRFELMEGARPLIDRTDNMTDLEVVIQEILQDKIAIDYKASGLAEPE